MKKSSRKSFFDTGALKIVKPTKEDLREFEEHDADINLVMGHVLSRGIPWDKFSEIEIQGILKIHFEIFGYDVIWRHRDDPANEKGVDLECIREADGNKVIVAVKKKPMKEALGQVVELADQPADQRIFVYLRASQSFRDKSVRFIPGVEFWNEEKLEEKLGSSGLALSLKVDNSLAKQAMSVIMRNLLNAITSQPQSNTGRLGLSEKLETIWAMKDRAVTVSRCAAMGQLMLEEPTRFGEMTNAKVQRLLVWCLDYLYSYGLLSLKNTFAPLSPWLRTTLHEVYQETKASSAWLSLFNFDRGLVPGDVGKILNKREEDKAKWKESASALMKEMEKQIADISHGGLEDAANELRVIGIWSDGLETAIDYVYRHLTGRKLPKWTTSSS
jgi:hypothetical protein